MNAAAVSPIPSTLRIAPYDPSVLDDLMAIELESFTAPWSRQSYEELAVLDSVDIWTAWIDDELVGYMLIQYMAGEAELHTFAVKPGHRRKGIGRRLLEYMMEEGRRHDVKHVYLQVRPTNQAARTLYKQFGFHPVGIRYRYYHDNGEDALVLRLDLESGC